MVSTDQMRSLTRIAAELDVARLVLVGDTSQLRAVDAGQPFRQLQQAGMTTARMDDILRQRNPELRAAVLAALAGEPGEAVELLGSSVHEVAYDELGEKAAQTWLELDPEVRDRTLLLAPTHALRAEINRTLRGALREEGMLRGKALVIERLVSLGMTRAEKGDVRNYREDDTIVFHQDMVNYRVKKDEALTVAGIEADRVHPPPPRRQATLYQTGGLDPLPARCLRDATDRDPRGRPDPLDPQRPCADPDQRRTGRGDGDRPGPGAVAARGRARDLAQGGRSAAPPYRLCLELDRARRAGGARRTG